MLFPFVSFPALVALEWSLPSVRLNVSLHAARRSTFKLVTNNKIAMSSQEVFARLIKWTRYSPNLSISAVELIFILKSNGLYNVLRVAVSIWKFYRIACTWMVSPWYASSCGFANDEIDCKHNYTGYIWMVSLLCASSSRELSNCQVECTNTRTMCTVVASHQSVFSCVFAVSLILLFYIRIDCTWITSP